MEAMNANSSPYDRARVTRREISNLVAVNVRKE